MSTAPEARGVRNRVLIIVLVANLVFFFVELAGGIVFRSLALLADAAHMLSDVVALSIALVAQRLAERPPTTRHTFGLARAEVLGAQANGVLLLGAAGWIVYEAVRRIGSSPEVIGGGLLAVASAGLVVNVVSAALLMPAVENVHHLHVWNLASDVPALSAHVVIGGDVSLHAAQVEGDRLRTRVLERFGIDHTTFELECHGCEETDTHSH